MTTFSENTFIEMNNELQLMKANTIIKEVHTGRRLQFQVYLRGKSSTTARKAKCSNFSQLLFSGKLNR